MNSFLSKKLLNKPPVVQTLQSAIDEWGHMELQRFYRAEETITQVKSQSIEWGKMFTTNTSHRDLVFRI